MKKRYVVFIMFSVLGSSRYPHVMAESYDIGENDSIDIVTLVEDEKTGENFINNSEWSSYVDYIMNEGSYISLGQDDSKLTDTGTSFIIGLIIGVLSIIMLKYTHEHLARKEY